MNVGEVLPNFKRGVLPIVILSLLKREDMYGYQLVQETQRCSGGDLSTQEGSLYPVLYKLLEQGYISDRRVRVGKRMTRVYYHLKPEGIAYLDALLCEYQTLTCGLMRIVDGKERGPYVPETCNNAVLPEGTEVSALRLQAEKATSGQDPCQGAGVAGTEPKPALC